MLGSFATLRHASSRAIRTLEDSIETAERLAEEMEITGAGSDGDASTDEEQEFSPHQARDRLAEVYRPLMPGRQFSERSNRTTGTNHTTKSSRSRQRRERTMETVEMETDREVRQLEVVVSYICFLILGSAILLPWNSEIVAIAYFKARLAGSALRAPLVSWVSLTFMISHLSFLALATARQAGSSPGRRVYASIVIMTIILALLLMSTRVQYIHPESFFAFLIASTVALAGCASYLQNATVSLSSRFGSVYLQGILSGQGAIGVVVAGIQFVAAYHADSAPVLQQVEMDAGIRNSAFSFFLSVGIFSVLALFAQLILVQLPIYKLIIRGSTLSPANSTSSLKHHAPSLRVVERKVRKLGIAVFYVFLVTLSVFPAITSAILSVDEGGEQGLGKTLSKPTLFVPLAFIVFAIGDWIGRALPQSPMFVIREWKILAAASAARTVFIPLFLMCNLEGAATNTAIPIINSDTIFLTLMLLFSLSNGYISTLIMLATVVDPSLEVDEIDLAATCVAFYLTTGLAAGSLITFPVRAWVCGCNPFLS